MAQNSEDARFDQEWHDQAFRDGLGRELDGALRRVQELKDSDAHPNVIADAEAAVENVRAEIKRAGKGQKSASKRPAAKQKETR